MQKKYNYVANMVQREYHNGAHKRNITSLGKGDCGRRGMKEKGTEPSPSIVEISAGCGFSLLSTIFRGERGAVDVVLALFAG